MSAPEVIRFDGGNATVHNNGNVQFSMDYCLQSIEPIRVARERKQDIHAQVTEVERKLYQKAAGQFCWLGIGAYTQRYSYGFYLQQRVGELRVLYISLTNGVIKEAKIQSATLIYRAP